MDFPIRLTYSTAAVLVALDAGIEYGFDVSACTGLRRGTVYPILRRMEDAGLVSGRWERPELSRAEKRPPRRYYRLTVPGREMAGRAAERFPAIPTLLATAGRANGR